MKRLGVVLALLVLFSVLAGAGSVAATSLIDLQNAGFSIDFTVSSSDYTATGAANGWVMYLKSTNQYSGGDTGTITGAWNSTLNAFRIHTQEISSRHVLLVYDSPLSLQGNFTYKIKGYSERPNDGGYGVGAVVETTSNTTYVVIHYWVGSAADGFSTTAFDSWFGGVYWFNDLPDPTGSVIEFSINPVEDLISKGVIASADEVKSVKVALFLYQDFNGDAHDLYVYDIVPEAYPVTFNLKDALTGQPLSGVTVKEGDTTLGTIDDGGSLELAKGTHELTFEKTGYWSVTKTIDVQSDMTVSVEMYPSSAAFKLENFPSDITIPENTIYELTFTLSPIQTSATYNTYLSLSGLSDIIEVRKDGSVVSPESGKYYLGDISSPVQVTIKFKVGSVGTHGFTITLTSNDAIMSKTYTTTKQVTYKVEPLPFSVQMPSEWQVGQNELRISESSGQSYLITAVLKDSQGNEVWSDSHAFSPYEAHTFQINVPAEGSYTLELTWNGQTAVYSIQVNPAITLVTKTLTVSEGGEGVITLHFKNPSSDVQYYTIKVSGGFLPAEINQSISVGPLTEKDVSITFAVPEDLTYDAYELNVAVMQGNATVFSDKVAVSISDSSGFSLFGGASSSKTLYYGLAALVGLGLFIAILRRR